jgi:hypothetical protein
MPDPDMADDEALERFLSTIEGQLQELTDGSTADSIEAFEVREESASLGHLASYARRIRDRAQGAAANVSGVVQISEVKS